MHNLRTSLTRKKFNHLLRAYSSIFGRLTLHVIHDALYLRIPNHLESLLKTIRIGNAQPDRHPAGMVVLSLRVPADLRESFSRECDRRGMSNSDVLRKLMAAYLRRAANG